MINLALHYPTAAAQLITRPLAGLNQPGADVLRRVSTPPRGSRDVTTALLLENCVTTPTSSISSGSVVAQPLDEEEAAPQELNGILELMGAGGRSERRLGPKPAGAVDRVTAIEKVGTGTLELVPSRGSLTSGIVRRLSCAPTAPEDNEYPWIRQLNAQEDERQSQLKLLIAKGKEQGYLTYSEVNDHLPSDIVDPEQIEDIVNMINDMGITVYEKAPDAESLLLSDSAVSNDEDAADEAAAALATVDAEFGRTTDPVRMYMREMGTVELLTREGEIRIAKRIEEGLDQVRSALVQFPPTCQLIFDTYDQSSAARRGCRI